MFVILLVLGLLLFLIVGFWIIGQLVGVVLFLVVAALCGAAAEYFLGEKEGVGETLLIGLIGAAVGAILAHIFHLPTWPSPAHVPLLWTIVGSVIVVSILKLTRGSSRPVRRLR